MPEMLCVSISSNIIEEQYHGRICGQARPEPVPDSPRRIAAYAALRLSLYFGNSPEFWMNLQSHYDLKMARSDLKPGDIKRIKARRAA
jgi:hypothetical protein